MISEQTDLGDDGATALEEKLLGASGRTYLWVHMILNIIRDSFESGKRLLLLIDTLLKEVEDTYEAILNRSTDKTEARNILHIIVGARRPLYVKETDFILSIEPNYKCYKSLEMPGEKATETKILKLASSSSGSRTALFLFFIFPRRFSW